MKRKKIIKKLKKLRFEVGDNLDISFNGADLIGKDRFDCKQVLDINDIEVMLFREKNK